MTLADCIHFGPKTLAGGLLLTTNSSSSQNLCTGGENSTREPERGPSLTFRALWGSEKSGTYS